MKASAHEPSSMSRTVKLSRVESLFEELEYPVGRREASEEFSDVTVELADGEANLGELVADCPSEEYDDAGELHNDLQGVLPTEALGEPGQSEGDS